MRTIMKHRIFLLIVPLVLLSGCGATLFAAGGATPLPDTLHVRRVNHAPANYYPSFSPRTITDQQAVQQLYKTIEALPSSSGSGVRMCPNDRGLEYQLDFYQGHTLIQGVIYDPEGCQFLKIGNTDIRIPDESFVQSFAHLLGIRKEDLAPMPLYSCTIKSPCVSPTP